MILGIDPGLSGAIVAYDPVNRCVLAARNIPTLALSRNGKSKREVNIHVLVEVVRQFAARHAFIEQVGAMPGQGVSSMFAFGRVTGLIDASVVAAGIPYTKVPPAVWKRALGCTADKDGTLQRAGQLMPSSVSYWTPERGVRDKEDCKGVAEAALIAYYGAQK